MSVLMKYNYREGLIAMYNKHNKPQNIKIRTLVSPGMSYLALSYFGQYLTLKLVPYIGKDAVGRDQYSKDKFISTTLSYEGAAYFYEVAVSIITGAETDKQLPATLPCKRDATLTLEYKPDENNQLTAYLVGNKNGETITFIFKTRQIQKWLDDQPVTQVIQADLEEFAMVLYGYIQSSPYAEYLLKKATGVS